MPIKQLELFGGVGAPRRGWENIGIPTKSIDYVEILPFAVRAYNNLFCNDYDVQDITTWNMNVDILVHGSPCQDFSKNGLNNINSGRSILYERTLQIIEYELVDKPKVVLWENVPNLLSKKHRHHFDHYLNEMERMGYINHFKIINAKHFGLPQNRDRVYTVSIRNDIKAKFEFPSGNGRTHDIKRIIDFETKFEDYQLSENEKSLFFWKDSNLYIHENTKLGYKRVEEYDTINVERPKSKTRRGRVQKQMFPTITTNPKVAIYYNGKLRLATAKEYLRSMGYTDIDYGKMINCGLKEKDISFLAGNSIAVPVLESIFKLLIDFGILSC